MSILKVPSLLDDLALAGSEGVPVTNSRMTDAIELCQSWGFEIRVAGGTAYFLPNDDVLVPVLIERETASLDWCSLRVEGFLQIGSTNDQALNRARAGSPAGLLIYAEQQTAARGRRNRIWYSPPRGGLYFSFLLRPRLTPEYWPLLTHVASLALVRALEDFPGVARTERRLTPEIKWPNDVLLSGRKAAGILLETACCSRSVSAVVVGVGVNLTPASIPPGLEEQVTAVNVEANTPVPRRWLLARFLEHFRHRYAAFESREHGQILQEWKTCSSMWDGTAVSIIEGATARRGITCGLSDTGALQIRTEEGRVETLLAADVSVRRG